jgi:hypothetical protein
MRAKEYIADSTYRTWVEGIVEQLAQPMFKEVLRVIQEFRMLCGVNLSLRRVGIKR